MKYGLIERLFSFLEDSYTPGYSRRSDLIVGQTNSKDSGKGDLTTFRVTSKQRPNVSINGFGASKSIYLRSTPSTSSANSSRFVDLKIGRNILIVGVNL